MTLCLGNELIMPKIYAVLYKENLKKTERQNRVNVSVFIISSYFLKITITFHGDVYNTIVYYTIMS